jgi:hypothetical protein
MGSVLGDGIMDKITEELFTSLIKRVEANEEEIRKLKESVPTKKPIVGTQKQEHRPGMASPEQLNFIAGLEKGLGIEGSEYADMTKKEASDYISKLKAMKENNQKEGTEKQSYSDPEKKPLTPEEIAEIGEENLL